MNKKFLLALIFWIGAFTQAFSLESATWRTILNRFYINTSIGSNVTYYQHTLFNQRAFKDNKNIYLLSNNQYYLMHWFYDINKKNNRRANLTEIRSKKNSIIFEGVGMSIPIDLSIHIDLQKKFRVGFGSQFSIHKIKKLTYFTINQKDQKEKEIYNIVKPTTYGMSYFGYLGYKFFDNMQYSCLLDIRIGQIFYFGYLKDINFFAKGESRFIRKAVDYNLGFCLEKYLSDNMKLFGRLFYSIQFIDASFNVEVKKSVSITKQQAIGMQLGISMTCPQYPKCNINNCRIKKNHKHSDKSFRGK